MKTCRVCEQSIPEKSNFCPECGAKQKKDNMLIKSIATIVITSLSCYLLFMVCSSITNETTVKEKKEIIVKDWKELDRKVSAYYMCMDWVKDRLKSPASADFQSVYDGRHNKTVRTNQRYKIESYVDSENSFGANIRTNFICITTQVSEGKWELNTLEIK